MHANIISPYRFDHISSITFSAVEYSKFKYGASEIGIKFGTELFQYLIRYNPKIFESGKNIVLYSSPYDYIPTATYTMACQLYELLNKHSFISNGQNIKLEKIKRLTTYTLDYGELSASERLSLIGNDKFLLDRIPDSNDILLFVDDIRITGSHEFVIKKMLNEYKISNESYYLYYAILTNTKVNPQIENYLNYAYVDSVDKLQEVIQGDNFVFNTRVIKRILALPYDQFSYIISGFSDSKIDEFKRLVHGNKYDLIDSYKSNIYRLSTFNNV